MTMVVSTANRIAKLLHAAIATAMLFLSASSFANVLPDDQAVTDTRSEYEKEQAMSPAERVERWAALITEASLRFGISEAWIRRVMKNESGGRTMLRNKRPLRSRGGAIGLMQIMPGTYRKMRQEHGLGEDPHDPRDNVFAGTAYLRLLYEKYGYPRMFAAYKGRIPKSARGGRRRG